MLHHIVEHPGVTAVKRIQTFVNWSEQQCVELSVFVVAAEQSRAEHGGERESADGRNHHHYAYHPAQLTEEHTGHAGDERKGEEHGYEGQRRGDYRHGNLVCAVNGRLLWIGTAFYMGRYVLKHHDCVVHYHAYRNRESR